MADELRSGAVEIAELCDDGDMIDGLVQRFERRVTLGMKKLGTVVYHLRNAKETLDLKMNLAADVMDREAKMTAEGK